MVFPLQTLQSIFKEEVVDRGKWTTRIKVNNQTIPRAPEVTTQTPADRCQASGSHRQISKRQFEEEEVPCSRHALEEHIMLLAPKL